MNTTPQSARLKMQLLWIFKLINHVSTRENACILILCRNEEAEGISKSITDFEATFNSRYGYPYIFLNDKDFTEEFKNQVLKVISTTAEFGKLTPEQWGPPEWIDMQKSQAAMDDMKRRNIIYGDSLSYRNMCRFFSGYFYRHELVRKYDYYWRIEPDVNFYCDLYYDPFEYMRKNGIKYGFTITIKEFMETIPTLWQTTIEFLEKHRDMLHDNEILSFILDGQKHYNGCHFWTNFEIGDFSFFRSQLYGKYFEYLDKAGGFYYERWGDAPVHALAVSLFLNPKEIYYFEDIGYRHSVYQHCPTSPSRLVNCRCSPLQNVDYLPMSCLKEFQIETVEHLASRSFL